MYLLSSLQGQETSSAPVGERHPDRVDAGHPLALGAELVERGLAHPGHDPHRDRDVGGVGQLDADFGVLGAERAHREGDDVHRAALHAALEEIAEHLAHLVRGAPVVGRAGVLLLLGADVGAVLDPGDVARVRKGEVAVRALRVGKALEGPGVDQDLSEPVVLLGGPVAPIDGVGLGQGGDLLHPVQQLPVGRQLSGGGSGRVAHSPLSIWSLRARRLGRRRPFSGSAALWIAYDSGRDRSADLALRRRRNSGAVGRRIIARSGVGS